MTLPFQAGDVRSAHVPDTWKRPEHAHKKRPVLLVHQCNDGTDVDAWMVAALTKLTAFKTGDPRDPLPGWEHAGLDAQPFLWSQRLVRVEAANIDHRRTGRATPEMAHAVVALLGLPSRFAVEMLATEDAL